MYLQFKPGLRTIWRAAGTVQIGLSAQRGTILDGLIAADSRLIEQLRSGFDTATLDRLPPSRKARNKRLIQLLDDAGVLLNHPRSPGHGRDLAGADRMEPDAALWSLIHPQSGDGWPILRQRRRQRIVIAGATRLGVTLAATLAAAGVGQISVLDAGRTGPGDLTPAGAGRSDVGRLRQDVAADAVARAGGRAIPAPEDGALLSGPAPDLVMLIGAGAADASTADDLMGHDIPHLSVLSQEDDVVVGPLVRPGLGPCLRCLDLHRCDRDPAWPSILAQLIGRPAATSPGEESVLAVRGAGLAAMQALAYLDGVREPASAGATLEIVLPDGLVARRPWTMHPRCGCRWPPSRPAAATEPGVATDAGYNPGNPVRQPGAGQPLVLGDRRIRAPGGPSSVRAAANSETMTK